MIYGFLAPLKSGLAPIFQEGMPYEPHPLLGVAHTAFECQKEEKITFFSPRLLTDKETEQLNTQTYDWLHDVEYRIQVRGYLGRVQYNPATLRILGRYYYILQIFGLGGLLVCLWQGSHRPDDIAQFIYWVLAMPLCIALAGGVVLWHTWETIRGLRLILHSPIGIRVVILPQLKVLLEIVEAQGYEEALARIRDLGLKELIPFYRRASQFGRWRAKPPDVLGIIKDV